MSNQLNSIVIEQMTSLLIEHIISNVAIQPIQISIIEILIPLIIQRLFTTINSKKRKIVKRRKTLL